MEQQLQLLREKEGYETQVSRDGGTAVEQFHAFQPDLVLLDLMLPVLDGWAVLKKIGTRGTAPPPCRRRGIPGFRSPPSPGRDGAALRYYCRPLRSIYRGMSSRFPTALVTFSGF